MEQLLSDLLGPAQREVGRRWERREWNVAQEHAATAITDNVLAMLSLYGNSGSGALGHVLAGCVEGEWHILPARMAAELLRLRGWRVTFLGPSVPADDLAAHARTLGAGAVALSCSVPLSLGGAWRSIQAVRTLGLPVLAGGAGFGPEGRWSLRLGADGWAPDAAQAHTLLLQWRDGGPARPGAPAAAAPATDPLHLELESHRPELTQIAVDAALASADALVQVEELVQLRSAMESLVTAVENAVLVGEGAVVSASLPLVERLLPESVCGSLSVPAVLQEVVAGLRAHSARAASRVEATLSS